MKHISWNESDKIVCKTLDKFGVHINFGLDDNEHDDKIAQFVWKSVRELYPTDVDYHNFAHAIICGGLICFDTEKEAWNFYKIFEQELTDSSGIYACIYSPVDGCLTENT